MKRPTREEKIKYHLERINELLEIKCYYLAITSALEIIQNLNMLREDINEDELYRLGAKDNE